MLREEGPGFFRYAGEVSIRVYFLKQPGHEPVTDTYAAKGVVVVQYSPERKTYDLKGIVAYRVPANAHVRSLAIGLSPDGWARERLEYRVWPQRAGHYELTLSLPEGTPPRKATLSAGGEKLAVTLRATKRLRLSIPTTGAPLKLAVEVPGAALAASN